LFLALVLNRKQKRKTKIRIPGVWEEEEKEEGSW